MFARSNYKILGRLITVTIFSLLFIPGGCFETQPLGTLSHTKIINVPPVIHAGKILSKNSSTIAANAHAITTQSSQNISDLQTDTGQVSALPPPGPSIAANLRGVLSREHLISAEATIITEQSAQISALATEVSANRVSVEASIKNLQTAITAGQKEAIKWHTEYQKQVAVNKASTSKAIRKEMMLISGIALLAFGIGIVIFFMAPVTTVKTAGMAVAAAGLAVFVISLLTMSIASYLPWIALGLGLLVTVVIVIELWAHRKTAATVKSTQAVSAALQARVAKPTVS